MPRESIRSDFYDGNSALTLPPDRAHAIFGASPAPAPDKVVLRPPFANLRGRPGAMRRSVYHAPQPIGDYHLTLGDIALYDADMPGIDAEFDLAACSYRAYTKEEGNTDRPVTFIWAGGPFVSSALLDLCAFGPMGYRNIYKSLLPTVNSHSPFIDSDLVFAEYAVGEGVMPWIDPHHFMSLDRITQAGAATVEGYLELFPLRGSKIFLMGSSFGGGFMAMGVALELAKRGTFVEGIIPLSGHYDYTLQDYRQPDDPRPFTTYMPVMALTNKYHTAGTMDDREALRYFKEVSAWADDEYRQVLTESTGRGVRQAAVDRLMRETGLSRSLIEHSGLRIDPFLFGEERLHDRGERLSIIDGRFSFPANADQHDHATYRSFSYFMNKVPKSITAANDLAQPQGGPGQQMYMVQVPLEVRHARLDDLGLPPHVAFKPGYNAYRPSPANIDVLMDAIIMISLGPVCRYGESDVRMPEYLPTSISYLPAYEDLEFAGKWKRRRVQEAMAELLKLHPGISIMNLAGIYDPLDPPARASLSLYDVQRQVPELKIVHTDIHDTPFAPAPGQHTAEIRLMPAGHFTGIDVANGKENTNIAVGNFIRSVLRRSQSTD